jgi:hypothetical protein
MDPLKIAKNPRLASLIGVSAKVGVTLYEHRGEGKDVVHPKTLRVLDQM